MFAIKNLEDFEKLEELASIKNQIEESRCQKFLGKKTFPRM